MWFQFVEFAEEGADLNVYGHELSAKRKYTTMAFSKMFDGLHKMDLVRPVGHQVQLHTER